MFSNFLKLWHHVYHTLALFIAESLGHYEMMPVAVPHIYIVIAVYNEGCMIKNLIKHIQAIGYPHVIVVDDGSTDNTRSQIRSTTAIYIRHRLNRGKGAAIKTGLEVAKLAQADIVVTMDGDGQHNPHDIPHLIAPLIDGQAEVSLGIRHKNRHHMPWYKQVSNRVADWVSYLSSGLHISDSQSGFRAYSKHALDVINTRSDRYEYETEVIREIAHYQLSYVTVPITTVYTAYSQSKPQRQNFTNGLITMYKLLWKVFS